MNLKACIVNLFDKGRKIKVRSVYENYDEEFWEYPIDYDDLDPDVEEAIEEYVRDCDDVSIWSD